VLGTLGNFISASSALTSPVEPLPFRRLGRVTDRFSLSVFVREELVGFCCAILLGPSGGLEGFEDEDEEYRRCREKRCNGTTAEVVEARFEIDAGSATGRPERAARHRQDENIRKFDTIDHWVRGGVERRLMGQEVVTTVPEEAAAAKVTFR